MKILLFALNGSYVHTALSIRCLRGPLENAGFVVSLLEKNLRDKYEDVLQSLYQEHADIYGFSCYIWNIEEVKTLIKDVKALLPNAKIILGGPEVSFETERFADLPYDSIIRGEGERAMVAVCEKIRDGLTIPKEWSEPAKNVMGDEGILYRGDDFPEGEIIYYESSRGCPYRCAYCLSSIDETIRFKSVEQTLNDLSDFENLPQNIKIIKFVDRTFNADVRRANEIWKALLSESYTKHYHFEICASLLNEESIKILSKFPKGKIQLEIGLQSTNPKTLQEVARQIDPEQVLASVDRIHKMGNMHVHLDLIAGLPYETYQRFGKSFDGAFGHCDQLQLGFLKLLPGTKLRENREKYGYIFRFTAPYTVLQSNWISKDELYKLEEIADLLERYVNSDSFEDTISYVLSFAPSPFRFFEGLSAYIKENDGRSIRKISQNDAFRYLFAYSKIVCTNLDEKLLQEKMHSDYAKKEVRHMPVNLFR